MKSGSLCRAFQFGPDRPQGRIRIRAVRASRLGKIRATTAAFAADSLGSGLDQINRIYPAGQIIGNADCQRRLAIIHGHKCRYARAEFCLGFVDQTGKFLGADAFKYPGDKLHTANLLSVIFGLSA